MTNPYFHKRHKHRNKTLITLVLWLAFIVPFGSLKAQYPMALYHLENLPQSQYLNPANMPRANGFFGVPGLSGVYSSFKSDVSLNDLLQKTPNGETVTPLNEQFKLDKLYDAIGQSLDEEAYMTVAPIFFGFRSKRSYFSFSYAEKALARTSVPKDLVKMLENGFPDGANYDLSTMRVKALAYREFSFTYSRQWSEKLTLGASVKPIFAHAAAVADFERFSLDVGYGSYNIKTKGRILTSLPLEVTEAQADDELPTVEMQKMDNDDYVEKYVKDFSNPGFAIDLGGVYNITPKWRLSGSFNNLGMITWNRDLNSAKFNGSYTFDGISIDTSNYEILDDVMQDLLDSLLVSPDFNTGNEKFSSALSPILHLAAAYRISPSLNLGFLSRSIFNKNEFRQEWNLSANLNCLRILTLNTNFNYRLNGNVYGGLGLGAALGPLQLYVLTDHIPLSYSNVTINRKNYTASPGIKDANVMFGLNLVFGPNGYKDSPMMGSR